MAAVHAVLDLDLNERVLEIVAGVAAEAAGGPVSKPGLDDVLDRDLGIGSLERVELLLRLERTFGVRLPDSVMLDAGTPRALAAAIRSAAPAGARTGSAAPESAVAAPTAAATTAQTLVDALRWHAEQTPERVHIHLCGENGVEMPITYGELATSAASAAAGFRALGVGRGDRVALMLRTERAFFDAFAGALAVGAVPVPLYPPVRREDLLAYTRRQEQILRNAGARVLVTFAQVERLGALIRARVPMLTAVTTADRLAGAGEPAPATERRPTADDPALIQYTSGSTGDPKGVLLSHANILANIRGIGDALQIQSDDVGVSWLPLYHDMGLIGLWLGALYFGVPVVLMSPLTFLARPSRWLWAIHRHRGSVSAAPNFAFDLCARRVADDEVEGLDLSSWRVAVNGSEAVRAETIDRFVRRFSPHGFRPEAMRPAYGLAESSCAVTVSVAGRPARVDVLARGPFEASRAIQPAPANDPRALRLVSSGRPLPRHGVRIVGADGQPVVDRMAGQIEFRGPSTTRGYFRNAAATLAAAHDGWTRSGDLGYLSDGDLFVTGREKDLIIKGGRNISPDEIEAVVSDVPGIRPSCVAAFGIPEPSTGTERLVVVAESRDPRAAHGDLERAVRSCLVARIGIPPDAVVIGAPRSVLKTPSGKIRRDATRRAYEDGTLGARRSPVGQRAGLIAGAVAAWLVRLAAWLGRLLLTGWILLVLLGSLPVLWAWLTIRRPGPGAARAAAWWSRAALAVCGFRLRVAGLEHLREVGPSVLVANHASYVDPIVLMAALPSGFHFVAKRALTRYPVIATVLRKAGHLTIQKATLGDRLAGADEVMARLRDGDRLVVFPEGTFVRAPALLPFRLGAFRAAVETGRPIVPVAIAGTRRVLPDGTRLFRRAPITVTIFPPMQAQGRGWTEMVRLRDAAVDEVARGCGEAPSGRETTGESTG
jgi:fatty-acyl-CoA synthase